MRTEQEMLSLIAEVARSDENIRAAYLEGSRVNPAPPYREDRAVSLNMSARSKGEA